MVVLEENAAAMGEWFDTASMGRRSLFYILLTCAEDFSQPLRQGSTVNQGEIHNTHCSIRHQKFTQVVPRHGMEGGPGK